MRTLLLTAILLLLAGCTNFRFVVDAVPARDALTETTVLTDAGTGFASSTKKIAVIDVSGIIEDANRPGFPVPGENPVARFAEALRKAESDAKVAAVIVRINSRGGAVTASDMMYRELSRYRDTTGRPVVILMGEIAASGGYYLACAGDEIIAHPTTITGSIGVIMKTFDLSEGMKLIGIKADHIASGPNKAMGSPFAPMPAEHRELFQNLVNEFQQNFVAIVKESRPGISDDDLPWVTDGRVVTAPKAVEIGLIDATGDLYDAYDAAKRLAGLSRARLVKYHRPIEHVGSAYAATPTPNVNTGVQINLPAPQIADHIGFYYLWDPMAW
jgi:protease-4